MRLNSGTLASARAMVMRVSARRGGSANSARGCKRRAPAPCHRHPAPCSRIFVGRDVARDRSGWRCWARNDGRRNPAPRRGRCGALPRPSRSPGGHRDATDAARPRICSPISACGLLSTRMRRSSSTTSRSVATLVSDRSRLARRSASRSIASGSRSAGDLLIEGGVVMGGEGVVLAAILGDGLGKGVARHLLGAAEHHVLEEMRQARDARRIVHRAHLEPQHLGDDRGAVIGDHQHLHAVGQRELESVLPAGGLRRGWQLGRAACDARRQRRHTQQRSQSRKRRVLEPVKPAAARFFRWPQPPCCPAIGSGIDRRAVSSMRSVKLRSARGRHVCCASIGIEAAARMAGSVFCTPALASSIFSPGRIVARHARGDGLRDRRC